MADTTEPRSAAQVAEWITGRQLVIVAESEATGPVAFAACSPYSKRPCYAGIGEFSVYVAREHRAVAEIGIHRRHGKLDGIWRDCVIAELLVHPESTANQG